MQKVRLRKELDTLRESTDKHQRGNFLQAVQREAGRDQTDKARGVCHSQTSDSSTKVRLYLSFSWLVRCFAY